MIDLPAVIFSNLSSHEIVPPVTDSLLRVKVYPLPSTVALSSTLIFDDSEPVDSSPLVLSLIAAPVDVPVLVSLFSIVPPLTSTLTEDELVFSTLIAAPSAELALTVPLETVTLPLLTLIPLSLPETVPLTSKDPPLTSTAVPSDETLPETSTVPLLTVTAEPDFALTSASFATVTVVFFPLTVSETSTAVPLSVALTVPLETVTSPALTSTALPVAVVTLPPATLTKAVLTLSALWATLTAVPLFASTLPASTLKLPAETSTAVPFSAVALIDPLALPSLLATTLTVAATVSDAWATLTAFPIPVASIAPLTLTVPPLTSTAVPVAVETLPSIATLPLKTLIAILLFDVTATLESIVKLAPVLLLVSKILALFLEYVVTPPNEKLLREDLPSPLASWTLISVLAVPLISPVVLLFLKTTGPLTVIV